MIESFSIQLLYYRRFGEYNHYFHYW